MKEKDPPKGHCRAKAFPAVRVSRSGNSRRSSAIVYQKLPAINRRSRENAGKFTGTEPLCGAVGKAVLISRGFMCIIVRLTPVKPVPHAWFGDLRGKKLLGLASGGGQQMPVFAALGADCTVFDYSEKQLENERAVAEREGYQIRIVRGDMTKPLPFEDESFDLIFHPVSNCYIEDVRPVWRECRRVLRRGGFLISGVSHFSTRIRTARAVFLRWGSRPILR